MLNNELDYLLSSEIARIRLIPLIDSAPDPYRIISTAILAAMTELDMGYEDSLIAEFENYKASPDIMKIISNYFPKEIINLIIRKLKIRKEYRDKAEENPKLQPVHIFTQKDREKAIDQTSKLLADNIIKILDLWEDENQTTCILDGSLLDDFGYSFEATLRAISDVINLDLNNFTFNLQNYEMSTHGDHIAYRQKERYYGKWIEELMLTRGIIWCSKKTQPQNKQEQKEEKTNG